MSFDIQSVFLSQLGNTNVTSSNEQATDPINTIISWLNDNKKAGSISELEYQFACFVIVEEVCQPNQSGTINSHQDNPSRLESLSVLAIIGTLLIKRINEQSTCIDLNDRTILNEINHRYINIEQLVLPHLSTWANTLRASLACQIGGPVLVDGPLVFLSRNYQHELKLAGYFARQSEQSPSLGFIEKDKVIKAMQSLSESGSTESEFDWQAHAVQNSLLHKFSIITGGPGTGKTTTVIRLLSQIIESHQTLPSVIIKENPLKMALAAPTGKAALRLTESLLSGLAKSTLPEIVKKEIPTEATTLHRLLKPRGSGFYYNETNTLPLDVLILDEASMVDLSMMSALVSALAPQTQLVLLGDEQQLASVEAGNILAELCKPLQQWSIEKQMGIRHLTKLKKSYRFDINGGIGQVSHAVINSDIRTVISLLSEAVVSLDGFKDSFGSGDNPVISMLPSKNIGIQSLTANIIDHYSQICELARSLNDSTCTKEENQTIKALFTKLTRFQILACVRDGETGVNGLNAQFESMLAYKGYRNVSDRHFAGRPILITENAYHLGLFNGDIGIQAIDPETDKLVSYFIDAKGNVKKMFNQRLPQHESVFAMTVHKSQGSEFEHALLVLPEEGQASRLLSRELLYTAITRAKKRFSLYGHSNVVKQMVNTKTERLSGLALLMEQQKKASRELARPNIGT